MIISRVATLRACLFGKVKRSVWAKQRHLGLLSNWIIDSSSEEAKMDEVKRIVTKRDSYAKEFDKFPGKQFLVAGVSFNDRQSVLEKLQWGEAVIFEKEPTNKYDKNAVMISLLSGAQLGYVPRDETSPFTLHCTNGRIKSVGRGSGGFFGASVYVQPQLPILLPNLIPKMFEKYRNPLLLLSEADISKISSIEYKKFPNRCVLTGLSKNDIDLELSPKWICHKDTRICEFLRFELICKHLAQYKILENITEADIDLVSRINRWTDEETVIFLNYLKSLSLQMESNTLLWSIDIEIFKNLIKDLRIEPLYKLEE